MCSVEQLEAGLILLLGIYANWLLIMLLHSLSWR
jgi:hypothetical protein